MQNDQQTIQHTIVWLEKIVIGLNLCPFAKAIHVKRQIRYVVSHATKSDALLCDLKREMQLLIDADPSEIESTLLIHPDVLQDFGDYNSFLNLCDLALDELELDGVLQIASFHPDYQFVDTDYADVSNYSNRSPYPTLHLLREESIERVVDSSEDAAEIYERNIATLEKLGLDEMDALLASVKDE